MQNITKISPPNTIMLNESELEIRLRQIFKDSDLETTTSNSIRRRLEEEFAVDLNGRKGFIREQIELFLRGISAQNDAVEREEEGLDEKSQNRGEQGRREEEEHSDDEDMSKRRKKSEPADVDSDLKMKGRGGFRKPCGLSLQLQEFLGVPELPRTEVVKKIWLYIREKNLQNPKDKKKIICDESLRKIFRVKSIDMFQMQKVLSDHIWSLEATRVKSSQKERQPKRRREVGSDERKRKSKPQKGGASVLATPIPLSDALIKFLGTGEHELSRAHVVKRMWEYIKEHKLQDPSDRKTVLCDDKLKELFEVDSFIGFTVTKLLTSHFIKHQQ